MDSPLLFFFLIVAFYCIGRVGTWWETDSDNHKANPDWARKYLHNKELRRLHRLPKT
jgi:hypothetical protein